MQVIENKVETFSETTWFKLILSIIPTESRQNYHSKSWPLAFPVWSMSDYFPYLIKWTSKIIKSSHDKKHLQENQLKMMKPFHESSFLPTNKKIFSSNFLKYTTASGITNHLSERRYHVTKAKKIPHLTNDFDRRCFVAHSIFCRWYLAIASDEVHASHTKCLCCI